MVKGFFYSDEGDAGDRSNPNLKLSFSRDEGLLRSVVRTKT